jgi:hypothetical protein
MKKVSKILVVVTALGILALAASFAFAQAPILSVTTDELTTAGFTNVAAQPAANGAFALPNHYFRVNETVPASFGWGSGSNLVTVLVTPKANQNWVYNNGQMQTIDLAGKTQVRFTTANYYVVVTGPVSGAVVSLAEELAATP